MKRRKLSLCLTLLSALLLVAGLSASAADSALSEGLVAYWPFDNGFEGVVGPKGAVGIGSPALVAGVSGNAMQLHGWNYLEVNGGGELQPRQLTVAFWIKRTGNFSNGEYLIFWSKPGSGNGVWAANGWFLTIDDRSGTGQLRLWVDGDSNMIYTQAGDFNQYFPENEWVHIAVTFDSNTGQGAIYRNGEAQPVQSQGDPTIGISPSGDAFWMGFNGPALGGAYLDGALDEVRIYNRVLSQDEIKQLIALVD